jgi:phage terminase large subunit-like protein
MQACASDYTGFAGSNPSLTICDELWGFVHEASRRLFDEAVPSPVRKVSARLVRTYAGFENESALLEQFYTRGIGGNEVAPDLYESPGMICYWTHECRAPWQSECWIGEMRQALRPNQFARMIRNQWVRGEGDFLQDEWIAACTNPALRPSLGDTSLPIFVGIDASTKHDWCAVVATAYDDAAQKVRLVRHYVWKPTPDQPLDYTATIERAVIELQGRFWIQTVSFDPWQLSALAQRLTDAGVPMAEYPQTLGNLTAMGENLLALFKDRNIEIYDDADLRWSLTNAVGIESAHGFKIGKPSTGKKIDLVIALAMSALAAVRHNRAGFGIFEYYRKRAAGELKLDDDGGMAEEYERALDELERGNNRCAACKQPLQSRYLDSGPLGRFHPECYGMEKPAAAPVESSAYEDTSLKGLIGPALEDIWRNR